MRPLLPLRGDPAEVLVALRAALAGAGPAILPLAEGADATGLPSEVPRRVAVVVQTSGTSGAPKRVAISSDALLSSATATYAALGGPGRWVLALPVHYVAGLQVLVRAVAADTDPVLLPAGSFDPAAFAAAVLAVPRADRAYSALVPAQVLALLEDGSREVRQAATRLDAVLVGGQRLPESLRERAEDVGFRLVRTYGSSETSGGCVYDGAPLSIAEARIVGGEVQLAGAMLAEGYLADEERTARAFLTEEGRRWYRTGDAGEFVEGRLRVTGRLDDVLISGGEKVSLGLVESVVRELDGFANAVVVRAEHERWGEVPVVVAETPPASATDVPERLAALREAVGSRLGAAARPDRLVEVDRLPLLASGKPDRRALTDLARPS